MRTLLEDQRPLKPEISLPDFHYHDTGKALKLRSGKLPLIVPKPSSEHSVQKYSVARYNFLWNQLIIGWDLGTHC